MKRTALQFVRYNLVGMVNTIVGFSVIFYLMFSGISATTSNIIGYATGSIVSYFLNKKYTFKSLSNSKFQAIRFFSVLSFSYIVNLISLQWLLLFVNPYAAQTVSAAVYLTSSFTLIRFLVFKENPGNG